MKIEITTEQKTNKEYGLKFHEQENNEVHWLKYTKPQTIYIIESFHTVRRLRNDQLNKHASTGDDAMEDAI